MGLVFKADGTVDFKKSLGEVNSAINENRSAYKLARSEWDSSTSSVKKLTDKQEYLSNQTEAYAEKVRQLSEILESQENAQTRDEEAISKTRQQLDNAKASLNYYRQGLEEVNRQLESGAAQLEEYANKVKAVSDKATEAGKTLTKTVTAPILAVGTASVAAWQQVDEAYDKIAAGTGAVGDSLQDLNDVFDEVYGSFPATADEVGTAVADINTRLGFTDDALAECTKKFLEFSKVNNIDVSTAIQDVSRYMGDAGIEASEYSVVLDALTAASQSSGLSIDRLAENLTKYGAPMRALGFTTQESIAIFAQWEKAGVNTETAFSGVKKAISTWSAAGKDASVEFKKVLNEIAACPDIASATTLAIETFGQKAGPDLADAIQGGRFSIEEMLEVVERAGGTLDNTWGEMYDGADDAQVAMNNLKLAGSALGETIMSSLAPILQDLAQIIQGITGWFKGLDAGQQETIVKILALVAAIGPLLVIFGKVSGGISSILMMGSKIAPMISGLGPAVTSVIGGIKTAAGGLFSFLAANPVVLIIGAIIAILVALYTKCEWFRDGVHAVIDAVVGFFSGFGEKVSEIKDAFVGKFTEIKDKVSGVVSGIGEAVGEHLSGMKQAYEENGGGIKGIVAATTTGVKQLWDGAYNGLNDLTGGKLGEMVSGIKNKMGNIKNAFSDVMGKVGSTVKNGINKVLNFFDFDWSLPKIKLPHFKITGGFSLSPLKTPKFSIDWYAKGGILNHPTIFGQNGSSLLGGGEAGKEAVLPISNLTQYIREENTKSNELLLDAFREMVGEVFYQSMVRVLKDYKPAVLLDDEAVGEFVLDVLRKGVFG